MRHRQDTRLYYSISEASAIAKVKPHVLRYWETQFKMLRPKKNKAGNRMYRKRDLRLIQIIKELLYEKGFTISGARRKLLDERAQLREQLDLPFTEVDRTALLAEIRRDLEEVLLELKGLKLEAAGPDSDAALDLDDGGEEAGHDLLDVDDSSGFSEAEMREALLGDGDDLDEEPGGSEDTVAPADAQSANTGAEPVGYDPSGRKVLPGEPG